jgi:hypothetical protein
MMKRQRQTPIRQIEPWESRHQPLPAGVRSIDKIMPEVLNRYGLSLDELDECQPQRTATAFVSIMPHSQSVLEPMARQSSAAVGSTGLTPIDRIRARPTWFSIGGRDVLRFTAGGFELWRKEERCCYNVKLESRSIRKTVRGQ